ncbi:MAG: PTS glucose transporter subunit IIA, partial [Oscillospiraceae bacterium]|nr:PTS glucose transporter subunit IIA [Oscillospiraceae bacterium]
VGISSPDGMELLIHVGVDTVAMNGDGFQTFVQEGQKVKAGQRLITFDRKKIAAAGHPDVVVVLVTNSDDYGNLTIQPGPCKALDKVIKVQ